MKSKKSQLTIFVIIGFLLLVIFLTTYIKNKNGLRTNDKPIVLYKQQIENYVEQCLYDLSVDAIYNRISLQGGYINPENNNIPWKQSGEVKIPYWYYNGIDISPSLTYIEKMFGDYILEEIDECVQSNQPFKGIEIIYPNKDTKQIQTSINVKDVEVILEYPIFFFSDDNKVIIKDFQTNVELGLGNEIGIAQDILKDLIEFKETGFYLKEKCHEYNLNSPMNVFPFSEMIIIHDYGPYIDNSFGRTLTFQFMFKNMKVKGYCSG